MTQIAAGRWALVLLLLLSLGANVGILASLVLRPAPVSPDEAVETPAFDVTLEETPETPGDGPSGFQRGPRNGEAPGPRPDWDEERGLGRHLRMLERLSDRLGLEGEDRERFSEIQQAMLTALFENRLRSQELEIALRREVTSAAPDEAELEGIVDQLALTFRDRHATLVKGILASREILDEEQEREYGHFLALFNRSPDAPGGREGRGDRRRFPPSRRP